MVLGLLYTGIATPTEVGAIGACLSALIGICMGRLTWKGAIEALEGTVRITAMIFMIIIGASIFGYFMTLSQVPQHMAGAIAEMNLNRWVVVTGIIVGYFIISMFMDEIPLLLITLPLTFPLVTSLGFDPIWYGVVSILMVCMGLVFPPVGMVAFVVSATANVDLVKVYKGTSILIIAIFITTFLVMVFPQLALWLPSHM
jgi:tripartite ATP-independent transporter DctM subunit